MATRSASSVTSLQTAPQPSFGSGSVEDPTSSLRAAALRTLRSKRRKVDHPTVAPLLQPAPPPSPPPPPNNGSEAPTSSLATVASTLTLSNVSETVEGQIREEGEISDEESSEMGSDVPAKLVQPPQPTVDLSGDAPKRSDIPPELRVAYGSPDASFVPYFDRPHYILDENHIRPNLAMNYIQYDKAKDIILDLLGWGVPPEYLVEIGLSREIIYYSFKELNLRLPHNFDTTGLPLFPVLYPMENVSPHSDVGQVPRPPHSPVVLTVTPSVPAQPLPAALSTLSPNLSLPVVKPPQKEDLVHHKAPPVGPRAKLPSQPATNLHDIEQQRKQELLARKAVQASRRAKLPSSANAGGQTGAPTPTPSYSMDKDSVMTSVVPAEHVDEFLKSIGTASTSTLGASTEPFMQSAQSVEDLMHLSDTPSDSVMTNHPGRVDTPSLSPGFNATSDKNINNDSSNLMQEDPPITTTIPIPQQPSRRGTKRPVAADFVDFDQQPRNNYPNGAYGPHVGQQLYRRKSGPGFASVSGTRRCVIELSDSEDDGGMHPLVLDAVDSRQRYSPALRSTPTPTPMAAASSWPAPTSASSSSSIAGAGAAAPLATVTTATLTAKEREIRRMKEIIMIKEREQRGRLKKAATVAPLVRTTNSEPGPSSLPLARSPRGREALEARRPPAVVTPSYSSYSSANNGFSHTPSVSDGPSPIFERDMDVANTSVDSSIASTSGTAAAPIDLNFDDVASDLIRVIPGQVVMGQEQAGASAGDHHSPQALPVDAAEPHPSPSTQDTTSNTTDRDRLAAYHSLFESFPLLRCSSPSEESLEATATLYPSSRPFFSLAPHSASSASSSFFSFSALSSFPPRHAHPVPDMRPLLVATAAHMLDPTKPVCRYEVPGGGVCRDAGCKDVHLGRAFGALAATATVEEEGKMTVNLVGDGSVDPSDDDTARYVGHVLGLSAAHTQVLHKRLQEVRERDASLGLEERVRRALDILWSSAS